MNIIELTLQTNNIEETKEFYKQKIGFEIVEETEEKIAFAVGTSKLLFELTDRNLKPKYHFAFNIPTNKINEAIDWTLKHTELISIENSYIADFENWKANAIYFFDNNKNILEFIARKDLKNNSESSFSIETILNINEIGLVQDNPLKTGNKIIEKTSIDFFSKGPKREDFAAVGNENGLFVISSPNRKWYPTDEIAEKWNVKAKVKIEKNEYLLEFN